MRAKIHTHQFPWWRAWRWGSPR